MSSFTVIMPNYNNEKYIEEAIESVIRQTFEDWELLIFDDGSTDNSVKKIKPYLKDKRIKFSQSKKNRGCGYSNYILASKVETEIFGNLDSDDRLKRDALRVMYNAHLKYPNASLIYSQFLRCNEKMDPISKGYCGHIPEGRTNFEVNKISHFRTYKLSYYNKSAKFNKKLKICTDKDLFFKMEEVGDVVFIDQILYLYREHEKGASQGDNKPKRAVAMKKIRKEAKKRRGLK